MVRATFGSAYTLDGVGNRTKTDLNEPMMPAYNAETVNYTYSLGNILNSADGWDIWGYLGTPYSIQERNKNRRPRNS